MEIELAKLVSTLNDTLCAHIDETRVKFFLLEIITEAEWKAFPAGYKVASALMELFTRKGTRNGLVLFRGILSVMGHTYSKDRVQEYLEVYYNEPKLPSSIPAPDPVRAVYERITGPPIATITIPRDPVRVIHQSPIEVPKQDPPEFVLHEGDEMLNEELSKQLREVLKQADLVSFAQFQSLHKGMEFSMAIDTCERRIGRDPARKKFLAALEILGHTGLLDVFKRYLAKINAQQ